MMTQYYSLSACNAYHRWEELGAKWKRW